MEIARLQELKQKLTHEAELADIWSFYMDNFADYPEFTDLGEPAANDYLNAVVQKTCQQMFGQSIKINGFFLIHIPQYQLFHGPFQVAGRIGGMIYFEDLKVGLIAVSADYPPSDLVKYSRFSEIINLSPPNHSDRN
ncbi:hypothetical protein [Nostoc sp. CMAA1605]|uniref:hypothetical protein n=1 Tax=Nostoc sp. CMAA1605 TaxID=2055159 RepID=UPI001F3F2C3E|nr:hypothetical protein [Nostoc sp. CMAA1605]MCF4970250.1 hypothetical protein [Nostoc sp. CMAA1605]